MREVYFKNRKGNEILLGAAADEENAWGMIKDFMSDRDYKCHYVRQWADNERTWYDVGSHTEFFFTTEVEE